MSLPKSGWTAAFLICLTLVDVLIIEFTIGLDTFPDNHPWASGNIILLWIIASLIALSTFGGGSVGVAALMTFVTLIFNLGELAATFV